MTEIRLCHPTMKDVLQARKRIAPHIFRVPPRISHSLSERAGRDVWLIPECLQRTGAFKLRGALNRMLVHKESGGGPVITVSSGNHAIGVTIAGQIAGVETTVVVPESVSASKLEKLRSLGGTVLIEGAGFDEAEQRMYDLANEWDMAVVSSVDFDVIAGHGTIALEMLEALPDLTALLAPVASGGLLAGCAIVAQQIAPECQTVGVQSANAPLMYESLNRGELVTVHEEPTIADGLAGNVLASILPFSIIRGHVPEILLVEESSLVRAMWHGLSVENLVLEGAGAATLAAVLEGQLPEGTGPVGIILSGGNVPADVLRRIVAEDVSPAVSA